MRLHHVGQQGGLPGPWLEMDIMPSNLKKRVRARMAKTGESYQGALRHLRGAGDGGRLAKVIRKIITLAEARLRESEADRPALGIRIPPDDSTLEYLSRPRPAEEALRLALGSLDLATLRKIEAVMYAGREAEDVLVTFRRLPKDDRTVTAQMIVSKLPLAAYLVQGLRLASDRGVDLDADWPLGKA